MAHSDCERYEALLDRVVGDEGALDVEQKAFVADHPIRCRRCAASRGLYEGMLGLESATAPHEAGDEAWVDSVLAVAQESPRSGRRVWMVSRAAAVAAIVLAIGSAAAMVALAWFNGPGRNDPSLDTDGEDMGGHEPEIPQRAASPAESARIEDGGSEVERFVPGHGAAASTPSSDDAAEEVPLTQRDELPHSETKAEPALAEGSTERGPSIEELLERARRCRVEQDWSGEAAAYELLIETYPESQEAILCRVPLGQVRLEQLEQPGQALASFRDYTVLAPDGPLLEEARWGEADALHELGRAEEAQDAVRRFLDHHPRSLYAPRAAERLEDGGE